MDDIERRLDQLEAQVAGLREEERRAWALILVFLKEQRRAMGQQRAGLDRAIGGLEDSIDRKPQNEDNDPVQVCRKRRSHDIMDG